MASKLRAVGARVNLPANSLAQAPPRREVGIPSVDLIELKGNPHWHQRTDTLENMSPESLQKVADLMLTMLPAVEQAYVIERR